MCGLAETIFYVLLQWIWKRCASKRWSPSLGHIYTSDQGQQYHRATYFNSFIDLETEYASSRRGMVDDFDDTLKANKDITRQITQIVQEHDRHSLSKKFPKSLLAFPAALAA